MKYNRQKFNYLVKYCRDKFKLNIVVVNHPFADEAEGYFHYINNKKPLFIEVILPKNKRPDWNYYASIIIHECSHWILNFRAHSEYEAWEIGKIIFPKYKIPYKYNFYSKKCLKTYGKLAKKVSK